MTVAAISMPYGGNRDTAGIRFIDAAITKFPAGQRNPEQLHRLSFLSGADFRQVRLIDHYHVNPRPY